MSIRVLGADGVGLPDPARLGVEGAVERISEDRRRRSRARIGGQRQHRLRQSVDPQQRDVVVGIEGDHLGASAPSRRRRPGPRCRFSPATTWALVTTSPGAATQPLPSIPSPQAVPNTRTTLRRAARTEPSRRIARVGVETSADGPCTDGSGSNRASALRIGPDGGQQPIELAQDRRALDVGAQRQRPRGLQRHRAHDPGDPEPDAGGQHRAEQAVDRLQSRQPQRRPGARADPLQAAGQHPADQQRRRPARTAARTASGRRG